MIKTNITLKILISRMSILVGVFLIIISAWYLYRGIQCEYWPTTKGVVLKTDITRSLAGRNGSSASYSPKINYIYQVEGRYYTGCLRAIGELKGYSNTWAKEILNHYSVGKTVLIHYDPENPEFAVLETGIQGGTIL